MTINFLLVLTTIAYAQVALGAAQPVQEPKFFTPEELQSLRVYVPASHWMYSHRNADSKKYHYDVKNRFSRGEVVLVGKSRPVPGVVLERWPIDRSDNGPVHSSEYYNEGATYLVQTQDGVTEQPSYRLGKSEIYNDMPKLQIKQNVKRTKTGHPVLTGVTQYSPKQLNELPVPANASQILKYSVPHTVYEEGGGENVHFDKDPKQFYSFAILAPFKRGELVGVHWKQEFKGLLGEEWFGEKYQYGIVLGNLHDNVYRVQISNDEFKDFREYRMGKMNFDFSLADVSSDEEGLKKAREYLMSHEILPKDIGHILKPSDPNLHRIKEAIQDKNKTLNDVKTALGENKKFLEIRDQTGYTPLLFAVYLNKPDVVQFLLKEGANPDAKTKDGLNAIDLAIHLGHKEVLEILTENQPVKPAKPMKAAPGTATTATGL